MPSLRCPIPHQSTSYRIKGAFDVRSEASPEPFMLTPGMWGGPGCGDKISEGMSTSGPHSSTSAPHCLQEEEQSKEQTCTHLYMQQALHPH